MLYQSHSAPLSIHRGKSFDFVPHAHHSVEILICTEGNYRVSCNFQERILHRGDAMIAFSNDVHAYCKTPEAQGIMIIVSPTLLPQISQSLLHKQYGNFCMSWDTRLVNLGEALYEEFSGDADMDVMVGYLYVICGRIRKNLPTLSESPSLDAELFSKILQYLSENYTQKLSLRSISDRFGISACHLSRTFTQKLSCSFLHYLHSLRVEHAKHLLRHSAQSILEIAYDSGFSDQRTFNRVFKELSACTPREYREACHTESIGAQL